MSKTRLSVVTGGGSGIGRATCMRLAAGGDEVVVADINPDGAVRVVQEIEAHGGQARFREIDVSNETDVQEMAQNVERDFGPPELLVNCAGLLQNVDTLADVDMEQHDRIWDVNYRGTFVCCRTFAPLIEQAGGGSIINISSIASTANFPLYAYSPGKAAVISLTSVLAAELGPKGIRVNAIRPGYVLTEQMQSRIDDGKRNPKVMEDQAALRRLVTPEDVAESVAFLASDAASAITGIGLPVDCGWLANVTYAPHPGLHVD